MEERKEVFISWLRKTFGANAFYTLTSAMEEKVREEYEEWEDALISQGVFPPDVVEMEGEEFRKLLEQLPSRDAHHIGECLYREEQKLREG